MGEPLHPAAGALDGLSSGRLRSERGSGELGPPGSSSPTSQKSSGFPSVRQQVGGRLDLAFRAWIRLHLQETVVPELFPAFSSKC